MMTISLYEPVLEKAAALSLRPSQYIGWEIGSTAAVLGENRPDASAVGPSFHVALVWPEPYERAMGDSFLIGLYERLSSMGGFLPERVFLGAQDYLAHLVALSGKAERWFSLEGKRPLKLFDGFVLFEPQNAEGDELFNDARNLAASGGKPFVVVNRSPDVADLEDTIKKITSAFERQFVLTSNLRKIFPLVSYQTREDKRILARWIAGRKTSAAGFHERRYTSWRVKLSRRGWSRFVSHLEQIQLIKNAVLLAGIPIASSFGRRPKLKISFGPAVSVGWESETEYFDMILDEPMDITEIAKRITEDLPFGYALAGIYRIPLHFPSLEESANWAEYRIAEKEPSSKIDWEKFLIWLRDLAEGRSSPIVVRKSKPGNRVDHINLGEILGNASIDPNGGKNQAIKIALRFGPGKNLKPEKILEVALGLAPEFIQSELSVSRTALALETGPERLRYL